MKILFGIQATGNGHLSRAKELYYLLKENPNVEQIDVLVSGDNSAIGGSASPTAKAERSM
jgi:hypothetical protein